MISLDEEIRTKVKKSLEISPALICRTIIEDSAYQNRLRSDVISLRPPILEHIEHRLEKWWRIHKNTRIDRTTLRVQFDHKLSDDSKVAACTPDTKEQIRVLVLAGGNHRTVGDNHRRLKISSFEHHGQRR
jgi:hypothetical protein